MTDIIYKYHGGGYGGGSSNIPARDLTKADLDRIKAEFQISEKDVQATKLYKKMPKKK